MKNLKSSHLFISSLLVLLLLSFKTFAFDYNIPFTATGASTAIDNIIVQNLTQGTSVTIPTGYSLSLSDVTSINQLVNNDKSLQIYPNPIQQKALVTFYSLQGGNTMINIFGIDGRNLVSLAKRLSIGLVQFQISLPKGVYTLQINESGIIHSAKIISQSNNRVKIQFLDAENTISKPIQKTKNSVIPFKYNNGDLLLFKATSGNYTTIQSDIISGNKEINFNFVECKDADGNYYPVVNIGSQVWMAENLKTSQYRNNTVITNKTTDTNWGTLTTEAYTDYNTPSKSSAYGKVYNWFVVNDSRTVAPIGWHIPTDAEWTTLTDFLGGIKPAGNKLKESGLTHWSSPNTGASNETGFTGLPGGARTTNIDIYDIGMQGYWWSSTVHSSNISAWYRCLDYLVSDVNRGSYPKTGGLSIRCIKGDFPALTTSSITDISATSAICGGNITNDGAVAITERGICWSTSTNPTITNNKTSDGSGSGVFSSTLTGLTIGTTYYVRAYATNNVGTSYGTQLSFSTILPSLTTSTATAITANSATSGGSVTAIGGAEVTERGVCWGTTANPTIADSKTSNGIGTGNFTSLITGLSIETTYYVRAYATNSIGTAYGLQQTFSTTLPTITTSAISAITATTATFGGNVTAIGGAAVTARGVCWSTTSTPTITDTKIDNGIGTGTFTNNITGLTIGTTYYVRAYATNSVGTAYGNELIFNTLNGIISLTTTDISAISATSATAGGTISSDGGAAVLARGVCWSTTSNPTITLNTKTSNGTGTGAFTSSITGLSIGTTYYVRAYATNSVGTVYGNQVSFSTILPVVTTSNISAITSNSATCGGEVISIGGATVTARGVCWSTISNPTISNSKTTNGTGLGIFTSSITGLTTETTYYVRAYATSTIGTTYGTEVSFSTKLATVSTTEVSNITAATVTTGGNVSAIGGAPVTMRGVCWSTTSNPTISNTKTSNGSGTGSFISSVSGLTIGLTYYLRAYASNSIGTAYGNQVIFSTALPAITTSAITSITINSAISGGNITLSTGAAAVTAKGVCWSTSINPTIALSTKTSDGIGSGVFTSSINGLTAGTTYYVRAYTTNSIGTAYGNQLSFTTNGTVTDTDGNIYRTIKIGTQVWMVENLKTTKYNDGSSIPLVTDNNTWSTIVTPAFCWYNNDAAKNKNIYGALYNLFAVKTDKLAPIGWHIPSDAEWTTLTDFLGGESIAGGKLKEIGITHWANSNAGATNEVGFLALPGGYRTDDYYGVFDYQGVYGRWWSTTALDINYAWFRELYSSTSEVSRSYAVKIGGFSVRCVKD